MHPKKKRWVLFGAGLGTAATLSLVVGLGLLAATGTAASGAPVNQTPPTITGTAEVGTTLMGHPGQWSGTAPIAFHYFWRRCNATGANCTFIAGAREQTYKLVDADKDHMIRVTVRATNSVGQGTATSPAVGPVKAASGPPPPPPASNGCPSGNGPDNVADVSAPAHLIIDQTGFDPQVVTPGNDHIVARFHVIDTCNSHSVVGALVYATAVPFSQLSIPNEQATGQDGWAELSFNVLSGFPASTKQQLMVYFVRARKPGESLLAGISARRLVSQRVDLHP